MKNIIVGLIVLLSIGACKGKTSNFPEKKTGSEIAINKSDSLKETDSTPQNGVAYYITVDKDITVKKYFSFMDTLVAKVDTFKTHKIDEYILVHANPWIIDSLRSFDYYIQMSKGRFIEDQSSLVILRQGTKLAIPNQTGTEKIREKLKSTVVDVNIPEFTLRIFQMGDTLLSCKVRVGRNASEFLETAGRSISLKTPIGLGEIVRISRIPYYVNPKTGKRYYATHRDDGKLTKMPIIPWIEPSINGRRYGAMIHPTTNPETLGKAYSHGCIGMTEADAWTVYYNAPMGTKVVFRYDLEIKNELGETVVLKDIYGLKK